MSNEPVFSELEYEKQIEKHLKSVTEQSTYGIINFEDVVLNSKGAYPTLVKKILDKNFLSYNVNECFKKEKPLNSIDNNLSVFSAPHPADYDWRFTKDTTTKITSDITKLINAEEQTALLGTQTLYECFIKNNIKTILFNKSKSILDDLRRAGYNNGLVEHDLFYSLPSFDNTFDLIVADPPWYTDYYFAFMVRSLEMLSLGGFLFLSVLPEFTRPSAIFDRAKILDDAKDMGFLLTNQIDNYFKYETPVFEFNSLKEEGICLDGWRTGDLWVFKKVTNKKLFIETPKPLDEPEWIEFIILNKKIKVRKNHGKKEDLFNFEKVNSENKTLSSVSRRSPLREIIDVWTSDNYAFKVSNISLLLESLEIVKASTSIERIESLIVNNNDMSENDRSNILKFMSVIL